MTATSTADAAVEKTYTLILTENEMARVIYALREDATTHLEIASTLANIVIEPSEDAASRLLNAVERQVQIIC